MRVYLAGETPMSKDEGWSTEVDGWQTGALSKVIKRRLYSYFFHGFHTGNRLSKEIQIAHECGIDLFLDSGAFSAHTQKETIAVDKYASFIMQHGKIFSVIANLDDIGDVGPKSWTNLKALENMGCKVFPVFHHQDDILYLKKMLDAGYPFIALGGLVGASRNVLRDWLDSVWSKYLTHEDGTPRLKVHGFGLTDFELMARYPWYSIDSSSWVMAGIFGGCVFYERGKLFKVVFSEDSPSKRELGSWHYNTLSDEQKSVVDKWLLKYNVTAQQCAAHYSFRHLVNAATYQSLESTGVDKFVHTQETLFG